MRMPALFIGHGSPMMALEISVITTTFKKLGAILVNYGTPKGILMISAHWYTKGSFAQSIPNPKQIYDMYCFPKELYEVRYAPKGNIDLTNRVLELLQDKVKINDTWRID